MDNVLAGVLAILVGVVLAFAGYRLFLILLPLWGFITGFIIGANAVAYAFGTGFLADVSGWIFGIVVGLVLAVLSYVYYWAAVIILAAAVGASLGTGVAQALGMSGGTTLTIAAIAGAVIAAIVAAVLGLPKWIVIVFTAIAGGTTIVGGILLILGRLTVGQFSLGAVAAYFRDSSTSWLWVIIAAVIAICGVWVQSRGPAAAWEHDRMTRPAI